MQKNNIGVKCLKDVISATNIIPLLYLFNVYPH